MNDIPETPMNQSGYDYLDTLEMPSCAQMDISKGFISLVVKSGRPARSESVIPVFLIIFAVQGLIFAGVIWSVIGIIEDEKDSGWALVFMLILFFFGLLFLWIEVDADLSKTWITVTKDNILFQRGLKPSAGLTYIKRDSSTSIYTRTGDKWANVYISTNDTGEFKIAEEIKEEDADKLQRVLHYLISQDFDPDRYLAMHSSKPVNSKEDAMSAQDEFVPM